MQKTVNVVDEAGNRYEATYVKRARGLVKHGRARFIDETTICLACPPNNYNEFSEDNSMTHTDDINVKVTVDTETGEVIEQMTPEQIESEVRENAGSGKYTLDYFLEQIEKISAEHSAKATENIVSAISQIQSEGTPCGGSGDEIAKATADAVRYREETTQKLLDFYSKMVDELKPQNGILDEKMKYLDWVKNCIAVSNPGTEMPDFSKLWNEMK